MDVNLRSAFSLISYFKDLLIQCNGCVVNLGCEKGSRPDPGALGYSMVKAGIEMLTKSAAVGFAKNGVRVNAVAPSFVDTNLYRYSGLSESDIRRLGAEECNKTPLKRQFVGNPLGEARMRQVQKEEVAKAVIFLTSEQALKITGHVMHVDGGR